MKASEVDGRRAVPAMLIAMCCLCLVFCGCMTPVPLQDEPYVGPFDEAPPHGTVPPSGVKKIIATEEAPARPVRPPLSGPLKLTVTEAILLAVENNRSLRVERLNPLIQETFESQQRAAFDPVLGIDASASEQRTDRLARAGSGTETSVSRNVTGNATLSTYLPTGTTVALEASMNMTDSTLYSNKLFSSRGGFQITQSLLRGLGLGPNLASLRQARLNTKASEYELRGFAETLVSDVESTYWDVVLARRQIEIVEESLALAEKQQDEIQERINIGKLAETELAAASAEVALRREALITARGNLAVARLKLLQLINPPGKDFWEWDVELVDEPAVPELPPEEVQEHVNVAMMMRPDLNQARLDYLTGKLEIVKTRNGLLPKLDFFIRMGKTGYSDTFTNSVERIWGNAYDMSAGLSFEYPFVNREARASNTRARLSLVQVKESIRNLRQTIQVDVRSAIIDANSLREQVAATRASRVLQEEKVRVETEKFRVGKSTSLLVAQTQRDLLESQIAEIGAIVDYLKSLIALYRLEGSLLERRGISAPGRKEVSVSFPGG